MPSPSPSPAILTSDAASHPPADDARALSGAGPAPIWDLFCRVIDNHGDLGVALRLSRQLVQAGQRVRLWVDDASALRWMAPDLIAASALTSAIAFNTTGITVLAWDCLNNGVNPSILPTSSVWIELFGCDLPDAFVAHGVAQAQTTGQGPVWLNLEYLSAEAYVARSHGLPSPIGSGPARGWTKWFFYPGFTPDTGGLLHRHGVGPAQINPLQNPPSRDGLSGEAANAPITSANTPNTSPPPIEPASALPRLRTTLFCYEPQALPQLLAALQQQPSLAMDWRVMPGRPAAAFAQALTQLALPPVAASAPASSQVIGKGPHRLRWLPHMPQPAFDAELAQADLNFVRGEDSLVSALRAGKPLVWHIYPQDDDAHHAKLLAFLRWLQAPPSLVQMHLAWNGMGADIPVLTPAMLADWQTCLRDAQARLAAQTDLVSQLLRFVADKAGAQATQAAQSTPVAQQ